MLGALAALGACHREPTTIPATGSMTIRGLEVTAYADLASAIIATVPAGTRAVGFGELHARVDRASVPSALVAFTAALPALAPRVSDLVVETWVVDPGCGAAAQHTTAALETAVKRPPATKTEVAVLGDAARAGGIQPRAMALTCADYDALAPGSGDPDPVAMLTITTRELARVARAALSQPTTLAGSPARPWVALYGGALHNDRFPAAGVEEWSYAAQLDAATAGHFVEIDLVVPAFAAADPASQTQPWFALVGASDLPPDRILVWRRGERSYVMLLPQPSR